MTLLYHNMRFYASCDTLVLISVGEINNFLISSELGLKCILE